jgi:hypothetical protein
VIARRITMRRAFCSIVAIVAVLTVGATTKAAEKKDFIERFKSSPEVEKALESLKSEGFYSHDVPEALIVSGSCGVAGCSSTALVVQVVQTRGVNPQTRHVAALVETLVPSGKTDQVTLIQLSPCPKTP